MQRYLGVRGLTGALLTGLGEVSAYLAHNLNTDTERLKFLSARYPDMPVDNVLEAANYAADLVATAEIIESGTAIDLPALPPDYPMASSAIHYSVQVKVRGVTGAKTTPHFYTQIDSSSPLDIESIRQRLQAAAQEAAQRTSGKSPGAKAIEAATDFDISILSVWQS